MKRIKRWLVDADGRAGSFIGPTVYNSKVVAINLLDGKVVKRGRIVFLGVEINEREVFRKVVETMVKIEDEALCMKIICSWIDEIKNGKLGTCYRIDNGKLILDKK